MAWLQQNWLWLVVIILFVGMHMGGHRHGGHAGHSDSKADGLQNGGGEDIDPDDRNTPRGGCHAQH